MATITTDTYLDGGVARTAGETWTVNGATFTIRTDTRVHANAPASMTGVLGQIATSTSLGGKVVIDGRNVRWMPFENGSGTVPAIGTMVTQGGVSGYLLGVWANYTSAPTAVGGAMPSTGYLKFREVTGGAFSTGALAGIGADATSPDVTGWMEVVLQEGQSVGLSGCALSSYEFYGDWFDLGTTTGTAGQVIQLPTNGGGAATPIVAVEIETSPGSGVYEWYPVLPNVSSAVSATTLATDIRAKFVHYNGNGSALIGVTASASTCGYVPAAGCKIRCPNIFLRQATSAARAVNSLNATISSRARFNVGAVQTIIVDKVMMDWFMTTTSAGNTTLTNFCYDAQLQFTTPAGDISLNHVSTGAGSTNSISFAPLTLTGTYITGTVNCTDLKLFATANTAGLNLNADANGCVISDADITIVNARASVQSAITVAAATDGITFNNIRLTNGCLGINGSNHTITNLDYTDNSFGATNTTAGQYIINVGTSATGLMVNGITLGRNGQLSGVQPYSGYVSLTSVSNSKFRNFGTSSSFLSHGTNATLYPNVFFQVMGNSFNVVFQRVFIGPTRSSTVFGTGGSTTLKSGVFETVFGSYTAALPAYSPDLIYKNVNGAPPNSVSTYSGQNFGVGFSGETAGWLQITGTKPSSFGQQYVTVSVQNSQSGFSGSGNLRLKNVGEYAIFEFPFTIKGHTGFANTALTLTGTNVATNHLIEYSLDTGSGWGNWKTLNLTNLIAETISPAGFKFKLRITCTVANVNNNVQFINVRTTTTVADQLANLYDLDQVTLSFEGLKPGSEVRAYVGTDPATAVEIGGVESSGETFSFTHSASGQQGYIQIFAMGYNPVMIPRTYAYEDSTLLIQQVVDRNYTNPA